MNRNLVVVGAILIQLCLGAIYAWSVFTPALVLPLEDTDFESDDVIAGNTTVVVVGDFIDKPALYEDTDLTFGFRGGDVPAHSYVTVVLELRDQDGEPVSEYLVKGEKVYDRKDDADDYFFNFTWRGVDVMWEGIEIPCPGNWHIFVTVEDSAGDPVGDADILVNEGITGKFGFSASETQWIFSVGLAFFAAFTIIGGRLSPRIGPRYTAMAGGALLGLGYILGGLFGQTFLSQLVFIGVIGGIGIGLGYVVPIAVGIKWFPDKKGLITGLGVAGFGFGATLWVQMAGPFFGMGAQNGLLAQFGTLTVFMIYGVMFAALVIFGALFMVNPPEDYAPAGWKPPEPKEDDEDSTAGTVEFTSKQMLRTPQFWMIWTIFCFGALAGLMVIGNIALFGIQALKDSGYKAADAAAIAATAMSIYAITNGIGRIVWGMVSDRTGRKMAIVIMSALQGVMMLVFFSVGSNQWLFTVVAAVIGFNFGGNFALFPSITADYFGNKSVGKNYGFTFTSYGVGGIVGPFLGGLAAASAMGYAMAFYPAGVMCLIGAGIALVLTVPKPPEGWKPEGGGKKKRRGRRRRRGKRKGKGKGDRSGSGEAEE